MEAVLTTRERQELVSALREMDPSAPPENRHHPRRKTLLNLWVQHISRGKLRTLSKIVLVNASVNGVGMLSKSPMEPGEKFVLPLPFDEGGGWIVLAESRNCRRLASGHYKIGARFIDRIEDIQGDAKIPADWLGDDK